MKSNGRLIIFTLVLVALATACKYFFGPDLDWSGFSPVIAIALFAGFSSGFRVVQITRENLRATQIMVEWMETAGAFRQPKRFHSGFPQVGFCPFLRTEVA